MYAIIRSGGKQYRVEEGASVRVERLPVEEGARVELVDVLMIANDGDVMVGTPTIEGARVLADVESQGRDKKIIVFKYKSKVRTRKKTGHRQAFTQLAVQEILAPGQEPKAKPKRARKAKADDEDATTPDAEEAPKPRAKRPRKTAAKSGEAKPAAKSTRVRKTAAKADDEKPKPRAKRAKKPSPEGEE